MVPVEKRILIKAASMYYLDHMKQSEIAERMGVDRTTVSKYLKKAMNNGIVKIEVAPGLVISSSITNAAIEELGLTVGSKAVAVIKASNVIVGVED